MSFILHQAGRSDGVAFPGEAYRTYVKECYQENYLIQGKFIGGGLRVDLARIACPLLTITAAKELSWILPFSPHSQGFPDSQSCQLMLD